MATQPLLHIDNLHAKSGAQPILKGLDLTLYPGQVHVLMGQNGQGKTTIAHVLAGAPTYDITKGAITYKGQDLLACSPEARAALGLFVAFQQPITIPGVSIITFLKAAIHAIQKARGEALMPAPVLLKLVKEKMQQLGLDPALMRRSLNEGFSGGEKKRIELLQMAVLAPTLAIIDEPDSGLDASALQKVGKLLQGRQQAGQTTLIITHYDHLFRYITPDCVHIIHQGRILKQGDATLAAKVLKQGYDALLDHPTAHHE